MIFEPDRFPTTSRARWACRPAFTLIEMLTVIGILSVLIALSVISLEHVARTAKERDTQVVLNTATAMVAELNASGGSGMFANLYTTTQTAAAPGVVSVGTPGSDPTNPANTALAFTQQVIQVLLLNPKNMSIYNQLPQARKLTSINGNTLSTPLFLDGFGNPILFVPPGGLTGVTTGGATNVTIQTNPSAPTYFWASAGSDGNFTAGDDNIYSFRQTQ